MDSSESQGDGAAATAGLQMACGDRDGLFKGRIYVQYQRFQLGVFLMFFGGF